MPLDWVEVADGHDEVILGRQRELGTYRRLGERVEADAVGNGRDPGGADPQVATQLAGERLGHRDDTPAQSRRGPKGELAAQPPGVVAAAVHRDDVRHAGTPGGPCTVEGHRELVTVREIDPVAPESRRERGGESGGQGAVELEVLDGDPGRGQLATEPALLTRGQERDARAPPGLQLSRQLRQHSLGAAGAVRFNEMRDARAPNREGAVASHPAGWRRGQSPAAQASNAGWEMAAGTFTRRSAQGSACPCTSP